MLIFSNIYVYMYIVFICFRSAEADNRFSKYFFDYDVFLSKPKEWLAEVYSSVESFMPSFRSVSSVYHEKINSLTLVTEELIIKLYDNLKMLISNSDNIFNYLTLNFSMCHFWTYKKFHLKRCLIMNATELDYLLKHELYGQHLLYWSINKFLRAHLSNERSMKSLVMSFHGPTGCGKSYASKLIADILFENEYKGENVHVYQGSINFPDGNKSILYRYRLLNEIFLFTNTCERSIFIFDDMDKMTPGVIDVLIPFLMFELKKSIFIFISNIGSNQIKEIVYDAWLSGKNREDLIIEDFSSLLKNAAYYSPGGLQHSEFVDKDLIDVFVPFLPLEKKHIKQCIVKELELRKLNYKDEIVEKISDQFTYIPQDFEVFSASGCKKVSHKIDIYGEDY